MNVEQLGAVWMPHDPCIVLFAPNCIQQPISVDATRTTINMVCRR